MSCAHVALFQNLLAIIIADTHHRRVPNWLSVILLIHCFVIRIRSIPIFQVLNEMVLSGLIVSLTFFLGYGLGMVGAADVKVGFAVGSMFHPEQTLKFLQITYVIALIQLIMLFVQHGLFWQLRDWRWRDGLKKRLNRRHTVALAAAQSCAALVLGLPLR